MNKTRRRIHLYSAETLDDPPVRPLVISFDRPIPELMTLRQQKELFRGAVREFVDAMYDTVPSGFVDELLAELLRKRAAPLEREAQEEVGSV